MFPASTVHSSNNTTVKLPAERPLVTIAIPTYNRCVLLLSAIESALAQTHEAVDVLVCDNASSDGTNALMQGIVDKRVRHVRHATNIGLQGNWNACIDKAMGRYLLVLSDDDRLAPTAIEELVRAIEAGDAGDDIAFVYGRCEVRDAVSGTVQMTKAAPRKEPSSAYRRGYLRSERVNYPSATLFRTEDARSIGGYGRIPGCPIDTALAFELSAKRAQVGCSGTTTTYYLMHPQNLTSSISSDDMIASVRALGELSVRLAKEGGATEIWQAVRTNRYAQAMTLSHVVGRNLLTGSAGRSDMFSIVWKHRHLFAPPAQWSILARILAKLVVNPLIGRWRQAKVMQNASANKQT